MPPNPLTVRVVDPDGKPVAGLELAAHFNPFGSDWVLAGDVDEARSRTDADGAAAFPWAPSKRLQYVEVLPHGTEWKIDKTDLERVGDRVVTVHARRKVPVEGKLVMPAGEVGRRVARHGVRLRPGEQRVTSRTSGPGPTGRSRSASPRNMVTCWGSPTSSGPPNPGRA